MLAVLDVLVIERYISLVMCYEPELRPCEQSQAVPQCIIGTDRERLETPVADRSLRVTTVSLHRSTVAA